MKTPMTDQQLKDLQAFVLTHGIEACEIEGSQLKISHKEWSDDEVDKPEITYEYASSVNEAMTILGY